MPSLQAMVSVRQYIFKLKNQSEPNTMQYFPTCFLNHCNPTFVFSQRAIQPFTRRCISRQIMRGMDEQFHSPIRQNFSHRGNCHPNHRDKCHGGNGSDFIKMIFQWEQERTCQSQYPRSQKFSCRMSGAFFYPGKNWLNQPQ